MKLILVLLFIITQCFISVTVCQDSDNSYYYNEDQAIEIFGGGSTLVENPPANITWYTTDQVSTLLSCIEDVPVGEHYYRGNPICTLTKSQTVLPNSIANFIFKVPIGDKPPNGKNVSLTFTVQNITSVTNNATHITINANALLPGNGLATIENGMTLISRFIKDDNVTVIVTEQLTNCTVIKKFKTWVCPTVNPTLLNGTYTITYTYQYPKELKTSVFLKSPAPPAFSDEHDGSFSSKSTVFSFVLLITCLLISFCALYI